MLPANVSSESIRVEGKRVESQKVVNNQYNTEYNMRIQVQNNPRQVMWCEEFRREKICFFFLLLTNLTSTCMAKLIHCFICKHNMTEKKTDID